MNALPANISISTRISLLGGMGVKGFFIIAIRPFEGDRCTKFITRSKHFSLTDNSDEDNLFLSSLIALLA